MTYEDKETIDEIKAELEETRDLLKDKIITKWRGSDSKFGLESASDLDYFSLRVQILVPLTTDFLSLEKSINLGPKS